MCCVLSGWVEIGECCVLRWDDDDDDYDGERVNEVRKYGLGWCFQGRWYGVKSRNY
jgi:hypothetical protein